MGFPAIKVGTCLQLIAFCLNVLSASYWQFLQYYDSERVENEDGQVIDQQNFRLYVV